MLTTGLSFGDELMTDQNERRSIDQLVDLFVYAPVGLAYEYHDVLPKLIKRGKSQVQIAKFLGTMAAKQGQRTVEGRLEDVLDVASSTVAQSITDVGARVGLAPDPPQESSQSAGSPDRTDGGGVDDRPLPIAGYDELTAKQIVALLADLEPGQRKRIGAYESTHRARKTVMAKLASLVEAS